MRLYAFALLFCSVACAQQPDRGDHIWDHCTVGVGFPIHDVEVVNSTAREMVREGCDAVTVVLQPVHYPVAIEAICPLDHWCTERHLGPYHVTNVAGGDRIAPLLSVVPVHMHAEIVPENENPCEEGPYNWLRALMVQEMCRLKAGRIHHLPFALPTVITCAVFVPSGTLSREELAALVQNATKDDRPCRVVFMGSVNVTD